jgi:hypothetical protein
MGTVFLYPSVSFTFFICHLKIMHQIDHRPYSDYSLLSNGLVFHVEFSMSGPAGAAKDYKYLHVSQDEFVSCCS